MGLNIGDSANTLAEDVFEAYSNQLRQHKELWELCHTQSCYAELKDIFHTYAEEKEVMAIIAQLPLQNPLAWSHATAISALVYLAVRERQLTMIEAQEAFISSILKMAGIADAAIGNNATDQHPASGSHRAFLYPDLIYNSTEKKAYCGYLREILHEVPGLSLNVFRLLDLAVDANMINEEEAKVAGLSESQKIVVVCHDLLSMFLLLPKKIQTVTSLITIANAQSLYRFSATYKLIFNLLRKLPVHSERFPPGPADIEKRLTQLEDSRAELTTKVRKMLGIVADLKAAIRGSEAPLMSKIPYRLWLITNSSGVLSTTSVSPLWGDFDTLTGRSPVSDVDVDRAKLAFVIGASLSEVELLQWVVRQQVSAHAYALSTYISTNMASIKAKTPALFASINAYLDVFDLAVAENSIPTARAPTLVETAELTDESDVEEFTLFKLHEN